MTACASVSISIFLDFGSKSCSLLFSSYLCSTLESQPQQVIPITNQNNRACSGGLGMLAVASNSYNNLRERVDRPPPFLYSQPDFRDSCLERNHMKVSSFSTHQRRRHGIIRPPGDHTHTHTHTVIRTRAARCFHPGLVIQLFINIKYIPQALI